MGYAVAQAAREMGATVTLISATDALPVPAGVQLVPVTSTEELAERVTAAFASTDILIMAAAVADYRPVQPADQKMKKPANHANLTLELTETPDILKQLATQKTHQFVVGFAAETQDLMVNAQRKLTTKHVDLLVANDVSQPGVGFNGETNQVTLLQPNQAPVKTALTSKLAIARTILTTAIAAGAAN